MAQACAPSQQRPFNATGKNEAIHWWTCANSGQVRLCDVTTAHRSPRYSGAARGAYFLAGTDTPALRARRELQDFLDAQLATSAGTRVLDAGCGGAARIRLPEGAQIIGIDISPESAARNTAIADIIIGDVQTYPLPHNAFDVVVCWELLEHVREPRAALARFVGTLRQDGLIVLAIPIPFR